MKTTNHDLAAVPSTALLAVEFCYAGEFADTTNNRKVRFVRMNSPFYKGEKWAVRRAGDCLNKAGEWEWEPSPSARDDAFYERCRFDTLEQAHGAATQSGQPHG